MESTKKSVNRRQPFWMQEALKNEVEKYRGLSRRLNMPKIIFGMDIKTTTYPLVYYTLGCATLFPIPFISKSKFDSTYSLQIDDSEHIVTLMTNTDEWNVFCSQGDYGDYKNWSIADNDYCVKVQSEERILIILKILITNHPSVIERVVTLTMKDNENNEEVMRKEIKIKFKETYYNVYYVMNVPESQNVDLPLILDLPSEVCRFTKNIKCSDEERVNCSFDNDLITANFMSSNSPHDSVLYFFFLL